MTSPEREQAEALRTPEQWQWIRDRYKPDGLRRLARANRHYADEHGEYLPDVAALAYAEWERAEAAVGRERELTRALAATFVAVREHGFCPVCGGNREDGHAHDCKLAEAFSGEALAGGVSAAGRPPEHCTCEYGLPAGVHEAMCAKHPQWGHSGGGTAAVAEAGDYYGLSDDEFRAVVQATRVADRAFEREGGGTRHWLRDHFLAALDAAGFRIAALTTATAKRSLQDPAVVPAVPEVLPEETP